MIPSLIRIAHTHAVHVVHEVGPRLALLLGAALATPGLTLLLAAHLRKAR